MAKLEIKTHGTVQVQYRDFAHAMDTFMEKLDRLAGHYGRQNTFDIKANGWEQIGEELDWLLAHWADEQADPKGE